MNLTDFQFVAEFLKRRSGLALTPDKADLVESRLAPLARGYGFADVASLVRQLRTIEPLGRAVVDAMTTNETWFFRDQRMFEQFRDAMIPALLKARAGTRHLRIWCSGAASGQEPYSLVMMLDELKQKLAGWTVDVLATDISAEMIARAKEALYDPFEVQRGLPLAMLARHFQRQGDNWRLSKAIRHRVEFHTANLLEPFSGLGEFDIIFCRNVLIYFDHKTKADVLGRLSASLSSDGYLVLGTAETGLGLAAAFSPLTGARGVYFKGKIPTHRLLAALAG